jgi:hypothetical protein
MFTLQSAVATAKKQESLLNEIMAKAVTSKWPVGMREEEVFDSDELQLEQLREAFDWDERFESISLIASCESISLTEALPSTPLNSLNGKAWNIFTPGSLQEAAMNPEAEAMQLTALDENAQIFSCNFND